MRSGSYAQAAQGKRQSAEKEPSPPPPPVKKDLWENVEHALTAMFPAIPVDLLRYQWLCANESLEATVEALLLVDQYPNINNNNNDDDEIVDDDMMAKEAGNNERKNKSKNKVLLNRQGGWMHAHSPALQCESSLTSSSSSSKLQVDASIQLERHQQVASSSSSSTAHQLRQQASELIQERNEFYQRAAQAHRRHHSKGVQGAIAFYYAQQGHERNEQVHSTNMRAAWNQVAENYQENHRHDPYVLDLHFVRIQEAIVILDQELARWYQQEKIGDKPPKNPLKIITGLGRSTANRSPKLFKAVQRYLEREQWDFLIDEDDGGSFIVRKRWPGSNR